MRKAMLCLLGLLIVSGASTFGQDAEKKNSTQPPLPKVIHVIALTGQTNNIPQTTIFTPKASGLVRLSVYTTITVPSQQFACEGIIFTWTDDGGPQSAGFVTGLNQQNNCAGGLQTSLLNSASETLVMRVNEGTPLTYEVICIPAGTTYELYMTVEQLM